MQLPADDTGMDWNKILESLDEAKIPEDMTKEEFFAMSDARAAQALLAAQDFDESAGWQEFTYLRGQRRLRHQRIIRLAVAASVVLALGAGLWIFPPRNHSIQTADALPAGKVRLRTSDGRSIELEKQARSIQDNDIAKINAGGDSLVYTATGKAKQHGIQRDTLDIPRGTPFQLLLADGTRVWLNAESRLIYPAAFQGLTREVFLEGEGYFDVAPDPSHPFLVHTGNITTKVLGTAFNIRAYDASVVTTLRSGKVQVTAGSASLQLQPDEQAIVHTRNGDLQKRTVDSRDYFAWIQGDLYFDGATLGSITETLSRYYDYRFVFDDAAIAALRFTLDIPRPERLQDVLAQLNKSREDLRFQVDNKTITISIH
ncbi:FecR family protein [Chitinophaga solisilvae]|uniref:FecR family protein n=1 Tax=Chitinophaga solisilvae TaxID=1233460 RepID=UPI00136E49FC|nr:FecR domain-containing protein [Chitinophaga solisilvae]